MRVPLSLVVVLLSVVAPALAEPLTHAQRLWLYVTLAASPILTEELGALLGGVAVSQGQLRLALAIVAVTLGGWLATTALYVFGWWKGRWVRGRFPSAGAAMKRWLRAVRRRPWGSALAVRFAFGARLLLPLACGAAHLRPDVYLIGSLVSSIVWSSLFVLLGFWFGAAAVGALEVVRRYDQYAVGVIAGLAVVVWLTVRQRRRARAAAAAVTPVEQG